VNTVLATGQGEGAVSWLNYSFRLMYLPIGLFGVSIATAALPSVAQYAARDEPAGMRRTISSALRLMLMLNVPATAGLMALASPIVALLFQHGRFTAADTAATAAALECYAMGLVGYSAIKLAVPSFYALHDSRTPVIVSGITVALNIVLNVTLVHVLGYRGLALGTAIASILNAGILLWLLARRLHGLDAWRIMTAFVKISIASAIMAAGAWEVHRLLVAFLPGRGSLLAAVRLFTSIGLALILLGAAARILRIAELTDALATVARRFRPVEPRPDTAS
jgi:putative peptidoglycan lipid II flippase